MDTQHSNYGIFCLKSFSENVFEPPTLIYAKIIGQPTGKGKQQ